MNSRKILIVGGGIAGLAFARGLDRLGIAWDLVERAHEWAPLGAGIVLGPNAMLVMHQFGIADEIRTRGHELREMAITDAGNRVLGRTNLARVAARFGPSVAIHRATLHQVLSEALQGLPRLGTTVASLEIRPETMVARFDDGTEGDYALVVGADGLRSRTRDQIFGPLPPTYAGYTCWRFVVDCPAGVTRAQEMWGRGRRFGIVPIDDGSKVYAFAVANAPQGTVDPEAGRIERFRARFAGFGGAVPAILERLEAPEQLLHHDLEEIVHRPWHKGRAVLVGDAAHGMTPNMGQGAAMALEDVAVLVQLLGEPGAFEADPAILFAAWAARREPRVRWVQDQSRRIGKVAQWQGRVACAVRNALVRAVPDRANERAFERLAAQAI